MLTDRRLDKQNVVYTYHAILFCFTKQGNSNIPHNIGKHVDIMLTEISQSQKDKYLYEIPRQVKFIEIDTRKVVARGWGRVDKGMES